jgi:hypothetical protein
MAQEPGGGEEGGVGGVGPRGRKIAAAIAETGPASRLALVRTCQVS